MLEGLHTILLLAILKNHINEKSYLPYDRSQAAVCKISYFSELPEFKQIYENKIHIYINTSMNIIAKNRFKNGLNPL